MYSDLETCKEDQEKLSHLESKELKDLRIQSCSAHSKVDHFWSGHMIHSADPPPSKTAITGKKLCKK